MNVTTATPVEIDTRLAELYREIAKAESRVDHLTGANRSGKFRGQPVGTPEQIEAAEIAVSDAREATVPFDMEFERRGGWTRVFVVPGGHAHRSTACHTLYVTTLISWMPAWSGRDEAEIVDAAGDRACTVCYPTAPVDKPTRLFTDEEVKDNEAREVERQERAAKAAAKAAKAITNPDGSMLRDESGYEIKTERTAEITLVSLMSNHEAYGYDPYLNAQERIAGALAHKRGVEVSQVMDEARVKAAKKAKKDKVASEKWAKQLGLDRFNV